MAVTVFADPQAYQLGLDAKSLANQQTALQILGTQRMFAQQDAMMKARAAASAADPSNILQGLANGTPPGMPQGPIGAPAPPQGAVSDAGPSFPPMGASQGSGGTGGAPASLRVDPVIDQQKKAAQYYDTMMKAVAPLDMDGKQTEIYANARDKALTAVRQSETEARKEEVGKMKDLQGWMGAIKDQDSLNSVAKLANASHPGALDELGFPKVNGQYVWTPDVQNRASTIYQGAVDAVQRAQINKGLAEVENQKANTVIAEKRAAQQKLDEDRRAALARSEFGLKQQMADPMGNLGINKTGNVANPGASGSGEDFLASLPATQANVVKALAEGRQQFPGGAALRNPYWQGMLQAVAQYDPNFDMINYNARAKTRQDFTSGKSATTLNALNTVAGHLEELSKAADNLGNSSSPLWNKISNMAETSVGDPRVKVFNTTREAVASELTRAYRGAGGASGDLQAWKEQLNAADSPEQLHGVIAQGAKLLESKITAMGETYKQGMGTTAQPIQLVSPKARSVFDKIEAKASPPSAAGVKFLGYE